MRAECLAVGRALISGGFVEGPPERCSKRRCTKPRLADWLADRTTTDGRTRKDGRIRQSAQCCSPREHKCRSACRAAKAGQSPPSRVGLANRHKRASGACRFLANSLVEAVVSARSRFPPNAAPIIDNVTRPALLLSPKPERAATAVRTTAFIFSALGGSLSGCHEGSHDTLVGLVAESVGFQ